MYWFLTSCMWMWMSCVLIYITSSSRWKLSSIPIAVHIHLPHKSAHGYRFRRRSSRSRGARMPIASLIGREAPSPGSPSEQKAPYRASETKTTRTMLKRQDVLCRGITLEGGRNRHNGSAKPDLLVWGINVKEVGKVVRQKLCC
jgi:hypothetical protein